MNKIWLTSVAAVLAASAPAAYADMPGRSVSKAQMQKEEMRTETLRRQEMMRTERTGEIQRNGSPSTTDAARKEEQRAEMKTDAKKDAAFVDKALKSGRQEVALSQHVSGKTANSDVKRYADMLVADHTAVNTELEKLSAKPGTTASGTDAPKAPSAERFAKLNGAELDRAFLQEVIKGHQKSVKLYTEEAGKGVDPAAKQLAAATLPKIKQHLEEAKTLLKQVGAAKKGT